MGKGSKRRPVKVPREEFEDNWEKVFGKGKKQPKKNTHNRRWLDNKVNVE